jgi:S-adenosylmethionine/arginine decarboxylase-like enzyme
MMQEKTQSVGAFTHLIADLVGVAPAALRDASTLTGLLIAAAGAAGFTSVGAPVVRQLPSGGVTGMYLLDGCHIAIHSVPARELLLLDVLASGTHDARKALDVFARRLLPREVHGETRQRGWSHG